MTNTERVILAIRENGALIDAGDFMDITVKVHEGQPKLVEVAHKSLPRRYYDAAHLDHYEVGGYSSSSDCVSRCACGFDGCAKTRQELEQMMVAHVSTNTESVK